MFCHNCARRTLSLFTGSFSKSHPVLNFPQASDEIARSRFLSTTSPRYRADNPATQAPEHVPEDIIEDDTLVTERERPAWQVHKAALKEKLGGAAWNPRKKLSPDTMEGIRHLNSSQPDRFTTPVLAQHFKVSPEAIRRILKSKWKPNDKEYQDRMERWSRRGERIWTNLVEMGVKPPKKWREMGVGRATGGERPKWKSRARNMADVRDSANHNFVVEDGDIIPIAGTSTRSKSRPLSQRL
ncbi:required for respiratory growth protein 9, mitochondrial [Ampelomyces quisqualis]|uniref:Required for respiratory growth protein 9, mitochondrial n=1 Tax=Ampelomyces quisqualis TaxID=50730 RepID=A0A6A5QNW4_AMPQU|nr:required for respiratory growth protein 9, mitochondrial [Ampelomyces quisqualis]